MIFIVNAENRRFLDSALMQMYRHRKAVFVDELGWNIPHAGGLEMDRYDREDTIYLVARHRGERRIQASARLLPTLGPHLMSDVFPHTLHGGIPRGERIWEASRFCPAPDLGGRRRRLALLWEVFCGLMETSLLFGIERIVFQAGTALLPLALRCGWDAAVLGPTLPCGNDRVTAVGVDITLQGLRSMRERFGIPSPVTRFVTPADVAVCLGWLRQHEADIPVQLPTSAGQDDGRRAQEDFVPPRST
ncbi:hypothetical protein ACG33_12280 [Steroidobacter denitrificans]|uniref:Acyl-homoserine-lactone synthase n=1 Tax=Steroidobacter denitrificans TaxID=465721 RepID=A0A127FBR9_STEDE|nr:acyl-homoserine-lactone synthase [Steroidobacter denitrificans]AMN47862.1 hypothetical protein ACG33_12280 [Steroidobacter denitrificans]